MSYFEGLTALCLMAKARNKHRWLAGPGLDFDRNQRMDGLKRVPLAMERKIKSFKSMHPLKVQLPMQVPGTLAYLWAP
jgi:hypothetical protein